MNTTKKERAPKGMPTDLNLSTLDEVFNGCHTKNNRYRNGITYAGATSTPNGRIEPTSIAGMRRCLKFGLLTADRSTLTLTEVGESALCGWAFDFGARYTWGQS